MAESNDDVLRRLATMMTQLAETALHHAERLDRLDTLLSHQDTITERLTAAIERLDTTQARIETLLARMIPQADNGTEA